MIYEHTCVWLKRATVAHCTVLSLRRVILTLEKTSLVHEGRLTATGHPSRGSAIVWSTLQVLMWVVPNCVFQRLVVVVAVRQRGIIWGTTMVS